MKINLSTVVITSVACVAGYFIYKAVKKSEDEFKAHKEEVLGDRNTSKEIVKASQGFESKYEKSVATDILVDAVAKMNVATTINEFDKCFDKYNTKLRRLSDENKDERDAWLIFYSDELKNEERDRIKKEKRYEADRNRRTELEKARTMARAIDGVGKVLTKAQKNQEITLTDILNTCDQLMIKF